MFRNFSSFSCLLVALASLLLGATAPELSANPLAPAPARDFPCTMTDMGYCTDKRLIIELSSAKRESHIPVTTAVGQVLVILLPRGAGIPKCKRADGESQYCIDFGNPGAFDVDVQELEVGGQKQFKLIVRPYLNDEAGKEFQARRALEPNLVADDLLANERGNMQIVMDNWLVEVEMIVGPADQAVRQVLLESKDFAATQDTIAHQCDARNAEQRSKLQEGWASLSKRAAEKAETEMAFAVLQNRRCRTNRWTGFRDLLWAQVDSICDIGEHRYITFRLRNRAGGGDVYRIGEVSVFVGKEKAQQRIEPVVVVFGRPEGEQRRLATEEVELSKDDEVIGTVRFAAKEAKGDVTLRFIEAGGKSREIELRDIGF